MLYYMYNWWTLLNAGSDPWKHRTQPWQKKLTEKCGKHNHHDNTKIAYFDIYLKFEMWRLIKFQVIDSANSQWQKWTRSTFLPNILVRK